MAQDNVKKGNYFKRKLDEYRALDSVEKRRWWTTMLTNNAMYIILILLVIYTTIRQPNFISVNSLVDMIKRTASSLIMALGVGGIIVLTGTDLSAGRAMGFTACIAASLLQRADYSSKMWAIDTMNMALVLLIVILIGAIIGLFNGFFVSRFSLHPFIVTLATQLILNGAVLIYIGMGNNNGSPISGLSNSYSNFVKGSHFNTLLENVFNIKNLPAIPNYIWYAIIVTVIMWVVWNKTTLGKNMYAVGSNPEAANVSGVNVALTTILLFTIAGALYGVNGFIEAARVGSNNATTGVNAELDAIAACVIGGVSFTGGVGKIGGIVIGVILLQVISVALQWLSVSANWQYIIKGIIILTAVSIDMQKYLAKK